ncbi:potassium-transporting ATPase subunit KdpC [Lacisediminihabitans sp.]|jgi:K+-transporting ATPase ATPase C chain|uniref:potassium-transporting ATPase subunit KdpC n=1 Tax=Lacisediminihabitans sp. TaxID=2787631 RepID=UPI002F952AFB
MSSARGTTRQYWVALKAMIVFTVVLGIGYPALIGAIGLLAPAQAGGSPVTVDGKTVGSSLIGQSFTDKKGKALPQWFQSRPSAAGTGYDAGASGGSNQGTESETLISAIKDRKAAIAKSDGVDPASIPADALTASASGLDPQISPEYAREQMARVAAARSLPQAKVSQLVERFVTGRSLGFIGERTVNVLELNIALAALDKSN